MLVPAEQHKEQLARLWSQKVVDPRFAYWNADLYYNPQSEIRNTSYRKDEWVSVENGEVVGYLCALVDRNTRSVNDLNLANFKDSRQYGFDLIRFIRYMARRYRYVRWSAVDGHPHEKQYKSILNRYNGRIVGTFKKKVKLIDGKLYDEVWYEIDNEKKIYAT